MHRLYKPTLHIPLRRWNSFNAREWMACHVPTPTSPLQARNALRLFQQLSIEHQNLVFSEASGDIKYDFQLHTLLSQKAPPSHVFQVIFSNSSHRYATPLLEDYLFMLLDAGNMTAATSILHVLLGRFNYSFSHQMWSFFASRAISSGHYASAIMVYHELIDPVDHVPGNIQDNLPDPSLPNPNVPFLFLPTAINALCILYQQNGNYDLVQGLSDYFERYYSLFGHRDVYQTLCIAKVETLSKQNDLRGALKAYNELAKKYRGYQKYEDPKKISKALMHVAHLNYKQTEHNIEYNVHGTKQKDGKDNTDDQKAENNITTKENDLENHKKETLFDPEMVSGFTLHNRTYAPFDGILYKEDLPSFHKLLLENISSLSYQTTNLPDRLLALISANHYSINKSIIISLCEADLGREAIAIINKMPDMLPFNPSVLSPALFDEQFIAIFGWLQKQLQQANDSRKLHKLLMDTFWLCQGLHFKHRLYVTCLRAFVSAYVESVYATLDELNRVLTSQVGRFKVLPLDPKTYQRAIALSIDPSLISDTFRVTWKD